VRDSFISSRFTSLIITSCYLLLGGIWAVYSNKIFLFFSPDTTEMEYHASQCYWCFILLSAGVLYFLLRYLSTIQTSSQKSFTKMDRALRSYSECTKALIKAEDELALIRDICKICVEVGGHKMAWVAFAENDADKSLRPVSHWGADGHFFQNFRSSWAESECGKGLVGTSIRIGEPVILQNLKNNTANNPCRETAVKCGYASCISLPLKNKKRVYGALVIFSVRDNAFDSSEAFLLTELANDLSYGIQTLRRDAERKHEMEERLMLAAVTDQASDGIITFGVDGTIQYLNPSFIKLCGISADDALGVSIHDFECSKRNPEFYQAVLDVFKTNTVRTGHFVNKSRDGIEHEIDARISPVVDDSGTVVRYVVTVMDVSQEVELQRQLHQTQKMEALDTLAGGIAHDFSEVLDKIGKCSEFGLVEDAAGRSTQENLLRILKEALKGKKLINQFTTINEQREESKKRINISDVVSQCMEEIDVILPSIIKLHTDITPGLGLVAGDAEQIYQVIKNICSNAVEAMQTTGGILEVGLTNMDIPDSRVCHYTDLNPGDHVKLIITDTGHGMERDELEKIFDPFYTTKESGKGRGLGLSIAHRIIKNHGGDITVNSIVGVGTTFVILLPLDKNDTK